MTSLIKKETLQFEQTCEYVLGSQTNLIQGHFSISVPWLYVRVTSNYPTYWFHKYLQASENISKFLRITVQENSFLGVQFCLVLYHFKIVY